LPQHLQQVVQVAAKAVNAQMLADYNAKDPAAFKRMVDGGSEPRVFPDDVMEVFWSSWQTINENLRNENELYRRVSDSATAFMAELREYDKMNQYAYLSFVYDRAG